jgi:ABC-type polysaccharide/polyol phosphate transport system ATPase subunit
MKGVAIACQGVWKSYRIYHQRSHTLKEKVLTRRNQYEEFWALQGIDLDVPVGETLGIVGPNGSGKSTLLKTMARILTPNKGVVQVFGSMSSLLELGTGFHPELTGRENVYLGGSLLGQSKAQVDRRYDEIVDFAGIERFMDMPMKNYSSGMYARLAFAVAISVDPEILLVDEVLSVGDESFQMRCYERIAEFRAQGRTIVLVSHSLDSIRSLCSEAVWLEAGQIRQTGKAHDVVAGYLSEVHNEAASHHGGSREGDRWGSGDVRITSVTLEGASGATGAFRTGDRMTIRVAYEADEPVDDVSCGVAIYRAETLAHIFGQNTHEAGIDLRLAGRGTIEFTVSELPLLKGNYVLTVALHDHAVKRVYDWHERRYSFMVFENPADRFQAGMVRVDGQWRTSSSPVAAA